MIVFWCGWIFLGLLHLDVYDGIDGDVALPGFFAR